MEQQSGPFSDTASTLNDADSCSELSDFADSLDPGDDRQAAPAHFAQTGSALHPTFHGQLTADSAVSAKLAETGRVVGLFGSAASSTPPPSSGQASSGSGTGSTDSWGKEEEGLVAVGRDLPQLRFLLTGSTAASPGWRGRLWASAVLVCAICSSLIGVDATAPILIGTSPSWNNLGYLAAFAWPAGGWIATECTVLMAVSLPDPLSDQSLLLGANGGDYVSGTNTQKDRFMSSLLNSKVTAQCANSISRRVKVAVLQMLAPFAVFLYFIMVMAREVRDIATQNFWHCLTRFAVSL